MKKHLCILLATLSTVIGLDASAQVTLEHAARGAFVEPFLGTQLVAVNPDGFTAGETPGDGDNFQVRAFNGAVIPPAAGGPLGIIETERNFHTFDLSLVEGTITGATLRVFAQADSYDSSAGSETVGLFEVTTDVSVLSDPLSDAGAAAGVFDDLGAGTTFGELVVTAADNDSFIDVVLNGDAISSLNAAVGVGSFAIGGALTTIDGSFLGPISERVFQSVPGDAPAAELVLSGDVSLVPEPAALGLLVVASCGLACRRRRS